MTDFVHIHRPCDAWRPNNSKWYSSTTQRNFNFQRENSNWWNHLFCINYHIMGSRICQSIRSRKAIRAGERFARTWGFKPELERYVHRPSQKRHFTVCTDFEPEGLKAKAHHSATYKLFRAAFPLFPWLGVTVFVRHGWVSGRSGFWWISKLPAALTDHNVKW